MDARKWRVSAFMQEWSLRERALRAAGFPEPFIKEHRREILDVYDLTELQLKGESGMAALQWRVEIEWACQERRENGRSVMDCIRTIKGWELDANEDLAKAGEHVLLTIDEMVEVEMAFHTGLPVRRIKEIARGKSNP